MIARSDPRQFGSFEGLDNRKELMRLFVRLGEGLPETMAREKRARFLQSLMGDSTTGLDGKPLAVTPCSAVEAYNLFIAITGVLGVEIDGAAQKLERLVKSQ